MNTASDEMSFWGHFDVLRRTLVRVVLVVVVLTIVSFCFKDLLFAIVLAPSHDNFILYQWLTTLSINWDMTSLNPGHFSVELINTELTGQFMAHIRVAFYAAIIVGMPYIIYQIFNFISPALYQNERRNIVYALVIGQILFLIGILLSYFIIFPFSFRFLALYEVDASIDNLIELKSYIDTMLMLMVIMGILFEMPLVSALLAKMRIINAEKMRRFRRHSIVAILIIAAILTPTTDAFTLILVGLPIYLLYEISIVVAAKCRAKSNE